MRESSDTTRPPYGGMTEEEIDSLVERVVEKVFAKMYEGVGKSVVKKLIWLTGIVVVGLVFFLAGKDALPK